MLLLSIIDAISDNGCGSATCASDIRLRFEAVRNQLHELQRVTTLSDVCPALGTSFVVHVRPSLTIDTRGELYRATAYAASKTMLSRRKPMHVARSAVISREFLALNISRNIIGLNIGYS